MRIETFLDVALDGARCGRLRAPRSTSNEQVIATAERIKTVP
jgi:hypothetical protein